MSYLAQSGEKHLTTMVSTVARISRIPRGRTSSNFLGISESLFHRICSTVVGRSSGSRSWSSATGHLLRPSGGATPGPGRSCALPLKK